MFSPVHLPFISSGLLGTTDTQLVSHEPQWLSVLRSVQVPSQFVFPSGHPQVPSATLPGSTLQTFGVQQSASLVQNPFPSGQQHVATSPVVVVPQSEPSQQGERELQAWLAILHG
jgi:hypothetical protein